MSTSTTASSRLIGRAELMLLLGVSRTRAVVLSDADGFPTPVGRLIMGNIWNLHDVQAWAEKRGRTLNLDALPTSQPADGSLTPQSKSDS